METHAINCNLYIAFTCISKTEFHGTFTTHQKSSGSEAITLENPLIIPNKKWSLIATGLRHTKSMIFIKNQDEYIKWEVEFFSSIFNTLPR